MIGAARATLSIVALCWGSWLILAWYFPSTPESFPSLAEKLMHFNLPGRLPEFAIGMWLASLWSPSRASIRQLGLRSPFSWFVAALGFYILAGTLSSSNMNLPLFHIYHVALSVILFLILLIWAPIARLGEFAFLKNISAQSFAIYIVHHPLFSYVGVMPSTVTHTLGNFVFLLAVLLPLSYLLAKILNLLSAEILKRFSGRETHSQ
jgi:peptidoglycan/LPS O-acetylase OafA/YrhL